MGILNEYYSRDANKLAINMSLENWHFNKRSNATRTEVERIVWCWGKYIFNFNEYFQFPRPNYKWIAKKYICGLYKFVVGKHSEKIDLHANKVNVLNRKLNWTYWMLVGRLMSDNGL